MLRSSASKSIALSPCSGLGTEAAKEGREIGSGVVARATVESRAPRRKARAAGRREWAATDAYAALLVPEHVASSQWSRWDADAGRPCYRPSWCWRPHPVRPNELSAALYRGDRVDVRGVEHVRYFVIDVDAHNAADSAAQRDGRSIDAYIRSSMGGAVAARRRRAVRDAAWSTVERLLELEPDLIPIQTGRGYHAIGLLDAEVPVAVAREMALAIAVGVDSCARVRVECFPRIERDGRGSMCSVPLTGSARVVASDGLRRAHRTRVEDVEWLVAHAPRISPAGRAVASDETRVSSPTTQDEPRQERPLADDGSGLPQVRNTNERWAFTEKLLRVLDRIERGQSRQALMCIAAGAVYADVPPEVADAAFEGWLAREHGARHAQDEAGRAHLRRCWRGAMKWQEKGEHLGRVRRGGLRRGGAVVRARFYQLAGVVPMPGRVQLRAKEAA